MDRNAPKARWQELAAYVREQRLALPGPPSQAELARRAGISQNIISKVERGTQGLALDSAIRLAAALEVERGELLRLSGYRRLTSGWPEALAGRAYAEPPPLAQVQGILLRAGWRPELVRAVIRLLELTRPTP